MSVFSRALRFSTKDLKQDLTLVWTFDDIKSNPRLYKDQLPVCFMSCTFEAQGEYWVEFNYNSQLSFTRPQVINNKILGAGAYVDINAGQQTTLTAINVPQFSDAVDDATLPYGFFKAVNKSGKLQNIAVATRIDPEGQPIPVLFFQNVEHASSVETTFIPVLRLHAFSEYPKTAIIREPTDSLVIWSQDLARLSKEKNSFVITRDARGTFHVTPSVSPCGLASISRSVKILTA
ncbi:hypothetical protein HWV62_15465 [Athelia sp. TMB]|nr:hypothetical protein HWV62_15465 [Athelia sp. TMB]